MFDPARQCVTITAPEQLRRLRHWSKERLKLHGLTDNDLIDDVLIVIAECGNNAVNYDRLSPFRKGTLALTISATAACVTVSNPLPPIYTKTPVARDALAAKVNARLRPDLTIPPDETGERGRGLGICGLLCADRGGATNAAIVMTSEDIQLKITAILPYESVQ